MSFHVYSQCKIAAVRILERILLVLLHLPAFTQTADRFELAKTIHGNITPKSIIYAGNGYFFTQNMMYSHKIAVYDRNYGLVNNIYDNVYLSKLGFPDYQGMYQGAPVEAASSHDGRYVWVTNYRMYGKGFENPGDDNCGSDGSFDYSFVYRIDTKTFEIDAAVKVGSVPKYIAVTPENRYALVSNWCSGDLSVIDLAMLKEVRRIPLGLYPRGIAIDSKSQFAYVAIMGSEKIARVSLSNFTVKMLQDVGMRPRHLVISNDDKYIYASLNKEHKVIKIDVAKNKVVASVKTGHAPRSMTLSADGRYLFVVNYLSGSLSVITARDMREVQNLPTNMHPIGVTCDPETGEVWVACYSGSIQVFINTLANREEANPIAHETLQPPKISNYEYHIIVGAFREEWNLKAMMNRCVKAGYTPCIVNPDAAVKKVSCVGVDDQETARMELAKAKDMFGENTWLFRQPVTSENSR